VFTSRTSAYSVWFRLCGTSVGFFVEAVSDGRTEEGTAVSGMHDAAKMQAAIAGPRQMMLMFSPIRNFVSGEPVPCKQQMFAGVMAGRCHLKRALGILAF